MKTVIITIFLVGILMIRLFCYLRCNIGTDQFVKHEKFNKNKYLVLLFPGRDNNLTERAVLVSLAESENEMIAAVLCLHNCYLVSLKVRPVIETILIKSMKSR